jgi:hypothetical protein
MNYRRLLFLSFIGGLGISLICKKQNNRSVTKDKLELILEEDEMNELIKNYVYRFSTR